MCLANPALNASHSNGKAKLVSASTSLFDTKLSFI